MRKLSLPQVKIYYTDEEQGDRSLVRSSASGYESLKPCFEHCLYLHEEFHVLLLNGNHAVLGTYCAGVGDLSQTVANIRGIMQAAILSNASSIIVAHNHLSGQMKASTADIEITKRIKEGCKIFGIRLLDHLIFCDNTHFSFADEGLL